jgi:hypothetical protein
MMSLVFRIFCFSAYLMAFLATPSNAAAVQLSDGMNSGQGLLDFSWSKHTKT